MTEISLDILKVNVYTCMFFCHPYQGDNICDFLFVSVKNEALPKMCLLSSITVGIPVCFSVIFTKEDNICDFQGG